MSERKTRAPNRAGIEFIEANVAYTGDDCLLWPYTCCTAGYGSVGFDGTVHLAHRTMCRLAHGEPPTTKHHAAHECGNRACVNPNHLSWKTPRENQFDRPGHGRPFTGRRKTMTAEQVREIRRLKGQKTSIALAKRFGCTESNIRHIQTWATYRHVV